MKALVKKSPEPGLWLENVPTPQISINDVLIKIHKTSICGTDFHIFNWDAWAQKTIKPPMVIGHEFVGTIEKMGSNVHDFKLGGLVEAAILYLFKLFGYMRFHRSKHILSLTIVI